MINKIFSHRRTIAALVAASVIATAAAFSPSYYQSNSALSSGRWVKVKVSENAVHALTYDQLRGMGFSDPSKVTVWGYGGASLTHDKFRTVDPDDLPQVYSLHSGDRMFFYGESGSVANTYLATFYPYNLRVNYYSEDGYYFLTDSKSAKSVDRVSRNTSNKEAVEYHTAILFKDLNDANPGHAGAHFFGPAFADKPSQAWTVEFDNVAQNRQQAYMTYVGVAKYYDGQPSFRVNIDEDVTLGRSNNVAGSQLGMSIHLFSKVFGYQFFTPRQASDASQSYTINIYPGQPVSYAALDWIFVSYPRNNSMAGKSQLYMEYPGIGSYNVIYFYDDRSGLEFWDVTVPYNIRRFNNFYGSTSKTHQMTPDRSYNTEDYPALRMVAFDKNGDDFPSPEVVGAVDNQNIHAMSVPHMLIITNNECQAAAERLAAAHREHQGIDVIVLNQQQVFNEFSSGTPDAMAYRRVAKMFWDRDNTKFRSLLLFGRGCFDNRQFVYKADDALLTYQVTDYAYMGTNATNYVSDDYFGMLDDYYRPDNIVNTEMNIAVGRIPATGPDINLVTEKIIEHLKTPPTQPNANRMLFIADDNDANKHEIQTEEVIDGMKEVAPQTTYTKVFNNVYPWDNNDAREARNMIVQALSQGQSYVTYTGHGNAKEFGTENIWSKNAIKSNVYTHYPFWMLATCDSYSYDRLDDGIGERLLYERNGGAIAIVASSRTVYADSNHFLSKEMGRAVAEAKGKTTIGQLYLKARNSTIKIDEVGLAVNTMCYNLGGDPESPYYAPEYTAKVVTINDIDPTGVESVNVTPMSASNIVGEITDEDGQLVSDFNGTAIISVFDSPQTITSNPKDGKSSPRDVTLDEALLSEVAVPVVGGHFHATVTVPMAQRPDSPSRMTFYAVDNNDYRIASGLADNIVISSIAASEGSTDTSAPVIAEFYLDSPDFVDGEETSPSPTLYATILPDESGFNVATNGVGAGTTLMLDNSKSYASVRTALQLQHDGTAVLDFPLSDLQDGRHSLTLSVSDNVGNRSQRTLNFVVVNRGSTATITADREYARDEVTFSIKHSFDKEPTGRLVIENAKGDIVQSIDNCSFPYTWDLKDRDGAYVEDGSYTVHTILKSGRTYGSTPRTKIVVIR